MSLSLQVAYPARDETSFDMDYYLGTHMPMVGQHIGAHMESALVTRGVAGGPEAPAPYYAIATMTFADTAAMEAAMAQIGPLLADIPNFYNAEPQVLMG